jgi:heme-based aerotactic transducer
MFTRATSTPSAAPSAPPEPVRVDTAGAPVVFGEDRWDALMRFVLLNEGDLELLAGAEDIVGLADAVEHSFYDHVLEQPELKALIERHSSVERLGKTLRRYFASQFTGTFDRARLDDVLRIGVVHDRIDLPIMTFIGAVLRIDRVVIPWLVERYADEPETLVQALMAYRKISTADVSMVTQVFIDERDRTVDLVAQLEAQADEVAAQQREIASVSESLAAAAQESHASASELSGTSTTIAEGTTGATALMGDGVGLAADGRQLMLDTQEAVARMRDSVDETATHLAALAERSAEITTVVDGIREIAGQTNLLALNAAIEAARAGEQGRGFAVVADEVRKLAGRTRESLTDISELNTNSLSAIDAVRAAVVATSGGVADVEQKATAARDGFGALDGAVNTTAGALGEISEGVDVVSQSARDLTSVSEQVARTAEQLGGLAQSLGESLDGTRETIASVTRKAG